MSGRAAAGRAEVAMSEQEVADFLGGARILQIATIGRDGRPHLVAMWYGFLHGSIALWTYARSQKVANLRRDPRRRYEELQGVQLRASVDTVGEQVWSRYMGPVDDAARSRGRRMGAKGPEENHLRGLDNFAVVTEGFSAFRRARSFLPGPTRVVVVLDVEGVVSWDHTKLA